MVIFDPTCPGTHVPNTFAHFYTQVSCGVDRPILSSPQASVVPTPPAGTARLGYSPMCVVAALRVRHGRETSGRPIPCFLKPVGWRPWAGGRGLAAVGWRPWAGGRRWNRVSPNRTRTLCRRCLYTSLSTCLNTCLPTFLLQTGTTPRSRRSVPAV